MAGKKVKVGEKITAGKDHKKAERQDIKGDPPEEKEGEEVPVEPAHEPEQIVTVRGTAVGGTKQMTAAEHDEWCRKNRKAAKKK